MTRRRGWLALQALLQRLRCALSGRQPPVFISATAWTVNGVNVFSANLARGLVGSGVDAQVLLTEEGSERVQYHEALMPRPAGVPFTTLALSPGASWGAHWGATLRFLLRAQPCVYLPNSDWRHSCVCPQLPDTVIVVGVVHSDDPLHYDHVRRLGQYWNLAVAVSDAVAQRTLQACPEMAGRLLTIPIGVQVPPQMPPRATGAAALRVIYHGVFKQHQKRVLDLPRIAEAALALGVPLQLTLVGAGPDEAALRAAAAPLVALGAVRFLGLVSPDAIPALLEAHDVYLLASEFEGMPNALLEAMGRGCVPVVSRMDSGIPQVLRHGENGLLADIGDCAGFAQALQALWRDPARRLRLAQAAHATVAAGGFGVADMVAAYRAAFERARRDAASGRYRRPRGPLSQPPAQVAGVSLFPVPLTHPVPGVGEFASEDEAEDFDEQLRLAALESGPLREQVRQLEQAIAQCSLAGLPVFVSATVWTHHGVNAWSESLVRLLSGAGLDARLLLTEEDTELVQVDAPRLPWPADLHVQTLALRGPDSWGARWGALRRLLEAAAPCVYVPNDDWRHAGVVPQLSSGVVVIAPVHDRGPLYREQVLRLGGVCNAVVWPDREQVRQARLAHPALARVAHTIQRGLHLPEHLPSREPVARPGCLWVSHGEETPDQLAWLSGLALRLQVVGLALRHRAVDPPPAIEAALVGAGVEIVRLPLRADWLALCAASTFVVVADPRGHAWPLTMEAMAQGCTALCPGDAPLDGQVPDRHSALYDGSGADLVDAVQRLLLDAAVRERMAKAAHQQALSAGCSEARMRDDYLALIRRCLAEVEVGLYRRRPGPLRPAPAKVEGIDVLPLTLAYQQDPAGPFPSQADARDYAFESRQPDVPEFLAKRALA